MSEYIISFESCDPVDASARLVMEWRNDPITLAMSYHHKPKAWDDFWVEFKNLCAAQGGVLGPSFVIADGERVGFIYYRPVPHPGNLAGQTVDISINIASAARGKGLGTATLKAACNYLAASGIDSVYAESRIENAASIKAFTAAGFDSLGAATKKIDDTGETCDIVRFLAELTTTFWRQGGVYVIAEAGSNWRGTGDINDTAQAKALIDVAATAGADAVKFQTYRSDTVYVANAGVSDYLTAAGDTDDITDIFDNLSMPYEMIPNLAEYCKSRNIDFLSTPFSSSDFSAIDPYVPVHKIASYEISHVHLIKMAARSGKPLILSTGASGEDDISWAVDTYRAEGGRDLCLMQCTASYPAPQDSLNVRTVPWLKRRFRVAAGLSDHSRDPSTAAIAAVALGARVIEKHFTLDNNLPGPDHSFALEPDELKKLVCDVRLAEQSLGDGVKRVLAEEHELATYARRGLQALTPIVKGDVLREGMNFAILRPGKRILGAHPRYLDRIEGKKAGRDIDRGDGLFVKDAGE